MTATASSVLRPHTQGVGDMKVAMLLLAIASLVVLLIAAPFFLYPIMVMKFLCFALFACAFNLLLGYVGLLSFGHSAFFGMASYVSAYGAKSLGLTPELAIIAGTFTAAVMGLCFGALAIRRQGIYFAMITLGLAQMIYFLCIQASFTGGEAGIQAVPRGALFGLINLANDRTLYVVVCVIFLAGVLSVYRIVNSPFGQALRMIRDNEQRAISLGYDPMRYKLLAFVLSAALAGLAGATKAIVFQFATLTDVHWAMSAEPILMTLVGGLGTFAGPIVGAGVIVLMQNMLTGIGTWSVFIQGAVFVLCVLLLRDGIVGRLSTLWRLGGRDR